MTAAPASEPNLLEIYSVLNRERLLARQPNAAIEQYEKLSTKPSREVLVSFRSVIRTGHWQVFGLTGVAVLHGRKTDFLLAVTSHSDMAEQCATR